MNRAMLSELWSKNVISVGRVGALAVALGVGAAIASMPAVASADTADSDGAGTVSSARPSSASSPSARPATRGASARQGIGGRTAAQQNVVVVPGGAVANTAVANTVVAKTGVRLTPPVAAAQSGRREARMTSRTTRASAAAIGDKSAAVSPPITAPVGMASPSANAVGSWQPGSVLRAFVGDGTASNPNGGLFVGDGFSYDATSCPTGSCNGGSGGVFGNGGAGYNGGNGGWAGWFGRGGAGGDAITVASGGSGGSGGVFVGDGGSGGSGAPAPYGAAFAGGVGGSGGDGGLFFGDGGGGGIGGNGITTGGGSGGAGGDGGFILSQGGRGGDGGSGTTGGSGGAAGVGRELFFVATAAKPGAPGSTNVVISDQYGSTTIGGKYVVLNNNYSGNGSQTITVTSTGFAITQRTGSTSTSGAPLSYPAVYLGCHYTNCSPSTPLPLKIGDITNATSSISYTYPSDASAIYDASYDIWMDPTAKTTGVNQQELMIWFNKQGGVQPISYSYDANGAVPIATTTIGGVSWNVYQGNNGANNVVSYVAVTPPITALTNLNLLAFIDDTQSRTSNFAQPVTDAWYLTSIQAGFEPWSGGVGLTVNSFDATVT